MNLPQTLFFTIRELADNASWTYPFLALAIIMRAFWIIWVRYVQQLFISKQEMVLLDVKLPKEVYKSPKAMEIMLGAFFQTSPSDRWAAYYEGKIRAVHSLEIVSREGKVHFYIWIRKALRNVVESQIYAQYPEIEIREVPDYTAEMPYGAEGTSYELWGCEYKLAKPNAFPIKTYIEYGLDEDKAEPEQVIDPLTSVIEFLGTLGAGEHMWFQIIIMAAEPSVGGRPAAHYTKAFKDQVKEALEELTKRKAAKEAAKAGKPLSFAEMQVSGGERKIIEAIERNASKNLFEVGMRAVYIARKEKFNGANIPGITGLLRPFSSNDLNSFKPTNTTSFDLPWEDPLGIRLAKKKRKIFIQYCKRGYFYYPDIKIPFILSTEELATIYHFPGSIAKTPTLGRIESKRSEAPVNLPI